MMGSVAAETHRTRHRRPSVISVASGKGGVGKTTLSANLAVLLAQSGQRVLAVDADLGLGNLDVALGLQPGRSVGELLEGSASVHDIISRGVEGVDLLPASCGRYFLADLCDRDRYTLMGQIDTLENDYDTLLVDVGAGIGANALAFASAAERHLVVTTSEPTALTDAYAFVKVLSQRYGVRRVGVVVNMVRSMAHGEQVFMRFSRLLGRFLDVGVDYCGAVVTDSAIGRSIHLGRPVVVSEPNSIAAQCLQGITQRVLARPVPMGESSGIKLFWRRLIAEGMPS